MDLARFYAEHPVFTHAQVVERCRADGKSRRAADALLARHVAAGRLLRVRRGVYAAVADGLAPREAAVDPYLLACRLTPDAAVAFHAALQLYGAARTRWRRYHCLTRLHARPLRFRDLLISPVRASRSERAAGDLGGGIVERSRAGGVVRVTSPERTVVDVLDAPGKCGGWQEIWPSLGRLGPLDVEQVVAHALMLDSDLGVARVGFYLEQQRERLGVEARHLRALQVRAPAQPRYLDSRRLAGRYHAAWNLVVPPALATSAAAAPAVATAPVQPGGSRARSDVDWRCW